MTTHWSEMSVPPQSKLILPDVERYPNAAYKWLQSIKCPSKNSASISTTHHVGILAQQDCPPFDNIVRKRWNRCSCVFRASLGNFHAIETWYIVRFLCAGKVEVDFIANTTDERQVDLSVTESIKKMWKS